MVDLNLINKADAPCEHCNIIPVPLNWFLKLLSQLSANLFMTNKFSDYV